MLRLRERGVVMIIKAKFVTEGEHIRVRIVDQSDLKLLPVDSDGEVRVKIVTTGEDFCAEIVREPKMAKALTLVTSTAGGVEDIRVFRPFE